MELAWLVFKLRLRERTDSLVLSSFTTSGQEMERVYSYSPGARMGLLVIDVLCKNAGIKRCATKQMLIYAPPAILTLHLKRFEQVGQGLRKLNRHVEFGELLDLAPYCSRLCEVMMNILHLNLLPWSSVCVMTGCSFKLFVSGMTYDVLITVKIKLTRPQWSIAAVLMC